MARMYASVITPRSYSSIFYDNITGAAVYSFAGGSDCQEIDFSCVSALKKIGEPGDEARVLLYKQ